MSRRIRWLPSDRNIDLLPFVAKRALANRNSNIGKVTRRCPVVTCSNELWAVGAPVRRERHRLVVECRRTSHDIPRLPPPTPYSRLCTS